jgi:hypothetical protein
MTQVDPPDLEDQERSLVKGIPVVFHYFHVSEVGQLFYAFLDCVSRYSFCHKSSSKSTQGSNATSFTGITSIISALIIHRSVDRHGNADGSRIGLITYDGGTDQNRNG